jgi:hypothetical protein
MDIQKLRTLRETDGVIQRRCCRCKKWKTIEFFSPTFWNNGGPCRPCAVMYKREWREKNHERHNISSNKYYKDYYNKNKDIIKSKKSLYYENHKDELSANAELNRAVLNGIIKRPRVCSICGISGIRIIGHHDDYSKPLVVKWVCRSCHQYIHHRQYKLKEDGKSVIPIPTAIKLSEIKSLLSEVRLEINYHQSGDRSLCRFCGGDISCHAESCLMTRINKVCE